MVSLLQCPRLIVNEAARTRVTAHLVLLSAVWHQFVFKGLKSLHGVKDRLKSLLCAPESSVNAGFSRQTEKRKDEVLRERRINLLV